LAGCLLCAERKSDTFCTAGKQRCYSLDISAARNNKSRDGIVQFGALAGIIASVYGPVPARTSERWLKKVENKKRFNSRGKLRFLQSSL
jgi:hypothetical protein